MHSDHSSPSAHRSELDIDEREDQVDPDFNPLTGIGVKLALASVVGMVILALVASVVFTRRLEASYREAGKAQLTSVAETWKQTFSIRVLETTPERVQRRLDAIREASPTLHKINVSWRGEDGKFRYVQSGHVHDTNGAKLDVTTETARVVSPGTKTPFQEGQKDYTEVQAADGAHYAELNEPVLRRGKTRAMLELHYDLKDLDIALARDKRTVLVASVLAAVTLWLFSLLFITRGLVQPLARLGAATRRLGSGDRGHRLGWKRRDEIGMLARDFDRMADQLDAAHEHLETLALTDPLTGLLNHRAFNERLEQELRRAERSPTNVSVVALDVDKFKEVNDAFGHAAGDESLRQLAEVMRRHLRPGDLCGRVGGDEFCLALVGATAAEAEQVIERLRQEIMQTEAGPSKTRFTISAGIAQFPVHGLGRDEILSFADGAMYWAKTSGRNRTCIYTADSAVAMSPEEQASRVAAQGLVNTVHALASAVDAKDGYTSLHSERVGLYAAALATRLGYVGDDVETIRTAGVLHDVGKIGISDSVLQKPGKLTAEEWDIMRRHSELGRDIINGAGMPAIAELVLHLHERYDGKGYPAGLAGEEIPLASRILHVADMLEAMTSSRVYRPRLSTQDALDELQRMRGTQIDPMVADAMIELVVSGQVIVPDQDSEPLPASA
ncbi:MAG: diguanylate cyclase [Solirubrobacteraceae bacterium]|nr:diguanylate cyclase [Solirubrobacteraceae bacterium]